MMRVVAAIEIQSSTGETMLGYRNNKNQIVTVTGAKEKTSDLFHALLSAEMEKEEENGN